VPRCLTPKQRQDLFLPPEPPAWCKAMGKWPYDAATLATAKDLEAWVRMAFPVYTRTRWRDNG
jgi:hypothetical protein